QGLWHIWQLAPGGAWSTWSSLAAPAGVTLALPAVASNADGRLEVFAVGSFNTIWHIWQTAAGASWNTWDSLGTPPGVGFLGEPAVAFNANGRLELFVNDSNGAVWHIWQTAPGASWSDWDSLGGEPVNAVGVGTNTDGRLE